MIISWWRQCKHQNGYVSIFHGNSLAAVPKKRTANAKYMCRIPLPIEMRHNQKNAGLESNHTTSDRVSQGTFSPTNFVPFLDHFVDERRRLLVNERRDLRDLRVERWTDRCPLLLERGLLLLPLQRVLRHETAPPTPAASPASPARASTRRRGPM